MNHYLLNQSPFFKRSDGLSSIADIFDNFLSYEKEKPKASLPLCNIEWEEDQVKVTAELPGVSKKNLAITIEEKQLSIKGTRSKPSHQGKPLVNERYDGVYERNIILPYLIEDGGVEAVLKDGVLTILLNRKEASKPKSIEIEIN